MSKVVQFAILDTPAGRREPDLLCQDGGSYPIEAKFLKTELVDAIAKVQNDYLEHYKLLGLSGGFAVLCPTELSRPMPLEELKRLADQLEFKLVAMFQPEDPRPFTVHEGKLGAVAEAIASYALQPSKRVEPNISYIINALRETVNCILIGLNHGQHSQHPDYILHGLRHLSGKSLREVFGGETPSNYILHSEEWQEDEYRLDAAYLLSYLFVNQLLFYHVLSRTRRGEFIEIEADSIHQPNDLDGYFRKVLDINYQTVFAFKVAALVPSKFTDEIRKIVNIVQGLAPEKVGGDLLGTIFHDLVPLQVRNAVGASYTNVLVADLLATLAIESPSVKVADLAVGSGGLLVAAYRRKKELLGRPLTEREHRSFVERELYGVDVMPFAASVAACHLAVQSPLFFAYRPNIAVWDSTDLRPGIRIPSVADLQHVLTGELTLDTRVNQSEKTNGAINLREEPEQEIELPALDVVMMNPPFSRMPPEYREILTSRFDHYKDWIHPWMGYHGYFVLLADKMLRPGGRIALVLRASVLYDDSLLGIREFLVKRYHIEHIVTAYQGTAFSENAEFREILLVAKKLDHEASENAPCAITVLKKLPETKSEARTLAAEMATLLSSNKPGIAKDDERLAARVVSAGDLRESSDNLYRLIALRDERVSEMWQSVLKKSNAKLVKLGEYLDDIKSSPHIGVDVFLPPFNDILYIYSRQARAQGGPPTWIVRWDVITEIRKATWILQESNAEKLSLVHRDSGKTLGVPVKAVRPAINPWGSKVIDVEDRLDFIVVDKFHGIEELIEEKEKLPKDYFKHLKKLVDGRLGNLSMRYHLNPSASDSLLVHYSRSEMVSPENSWSIQVARDNVAKALSLWLNSTIGLLQILQLRNETRGAYIRIDASIIRELMVPNPRKMSPNELRSFVTVFEKLRLKEFFPSILQQLKNRDPNRESLDTACLEYLGLSAKEIDEVTSYLYPALAKEIETLTNEIGTRLIRIP